MKAAAATAKTQIITVKNIQKRKIKSKKRNRVFYDDVDGENDYIEEISPSGEDDIDEDNVETEIEEIPIQKYLKHQKYKKNQA